MLTRPPKLYSHRFAFPRFWSRNDIPGSWCCGLPCQPKRSWRASARVALALLHLSVESVHGEPRDHGVVGEVPRRQGLELQPAFPAGIFATSSGANRIVFLYFVLGLRKMHAQAQARQAQETAPPQNSIKSRYFKCSVSFTWNQGGWYEAFDWGTCTSSPRSPGPPPWLPLCQLEPASTSTCLLWHRDFFLFFSPRRFERAVRKRTKQGQLLGREKRFARNTTSSQRKRSCAANCYWKACLPGR